MFADRQVVVHHVAGSLESAEVGVYHGRLYRLEGNCLRIPSPLMRDGVRYRRRLTWERAR